MSDILRLFPSTTKTFTLRRYFEEYFRPLVAVSRELSARTLGDYELCVRYFETFSGELELDAITPVTIRDFRDFLATLPGRRGKASLSAWTIKKHITNLRRLLIAAAPPSYHGSYGEYGQAVIGPAPIVPTPRTPRRRPKPTYTSGEVRAMLAATAGQRRPLLTVPAATWWRAIILTACYTGLRRGTLLQLRKDWLRGERLVIPAEAIKGQRADLAIALVPAVVAALAAIRDTTGPLVFAWQTDPQNLNRHLRAIYDRAGLDPNRWYAWHGFRRYVASELTRVAGLAAAATLLGHTHLATTRDHYASLEAQLDASLDAQQQALALLPRLL